MRPLPRGRQYAEDSEAVAKIIYKSDYVDGVGSADDL